MLRKMTMTLLFMACLAAGTTWAQDVQISDAYARSTVAGQKASSVFMKLRAASTTSLVGAASPVAGTVQIHEMKMDGDVMKMREVPALQLSAGQTVELTPGGYHVMLLDLKTPLKIDDRLPLTLLFRDAQGKTSRQDIQVPIKGWTNGSEMGDMHHDHAGMH